MDIHKESLPLEYCLSLDLVHSPADSDLRAQKVKRTPCPPEPGIMSSAFFLETSIHSFLTPPSCCVELNIHTGKSTGTQPCTHVHTHGNTHTHTSPHAECTCTVSAVGRRTSSTRLFPYSRQARAPQFTSVSLGANISTCWLTSMHPFSNRYCILHLHTALPLLKRWCRSAPQIQKACEGGISTVASIFAGLSFADSTKLGSKFPSAVG